MRLTNYPFNEMAIITECLIVTDTESGSTQEFGPQGRICMPTCYARLA